MSPSIENEHQACYRYTSCTVLMVGHCQEDPNASHSAEYTPSYQDKVQNDIDLVTEPFPLLFPNVSCKIKNMHNIKRTHFITDF